MESFLYVIGFIVALYILVIFLDYSFSIPLEDGEFTVRKGNISNSI